MKLFAGILGLILLLATLWDAFETIILPRRVTRPYRLVRLFYRVSWAIWSDDQPAASLEKSARYPPQLFRPAFPAIAFCDVGISPGPGVCRAAMGGRIGHHAFREALRPFRTDLYMSGTTFFTLGLGDVTAAHAACARHYGRRGRNGFRLSGRRDFLSADAVWSIFAARTEHFAAGRARRLAAHRRGIASPACAGLANTDVLTQYLRDWEIWSAQLMESHLSYPVLCYFRSQHDNQSWLAAFTTVLDVSALIVAYGTGARQMAGATDVRHFTPCGCGFG